MYGLLYLAEIQLFDMEARLCHWKKKSKKGYCDILSHYSDFSFHRIVWYKLIIESQSPVLRGGGGLYVLRIVSL